MADELERLMADARVAAYPPPLSFKALEDLIHDIDHFFWIGSKFSFGLTVVREEFMFEEAKAAFAKTIIGVEGFLRFIPPSQFYAKSSTNFIDICSACVLARQIGEDALCFFYLSWPDLSPDEKSFRAAVWRYHGITETIDAAKLFEKEAARLLLFRKEQGFLRRAVTENPMLKVIESNRRARIKIGQVNMVVDEHEILRQRGILVDKYAASHKILSNFVHFSLFCKKQMATIGSWENCWESFYAPCQFVASFVAELLVAFCETYSWAASYLSEDDRNLFAKWSDWITDPNWEPPRSNPGSMGTCEKEGQTAKRFCTRCGKPALEDDRFCSNCCQAGGTENRNLIQQSSLFRIEFTVVKSDIKTDSDPAVGYSPGDRGTKRADTMNRNSRRKAKGNSRSAGNWRKS